MHNGIKFLVCLSLAVSMGVVPSGSALKGVPTFNTNTGEAKGAGTDKGSEEDETEDKNDREENPTTIAQQASTLISLLSAQSSLSSTSKAPRVWLGDGLGSLPKRVHDRMMKWEFMDMQDFRLRSSPQTFQEGETQTLVALPGFELAQPRKKPIDNIITWVQCFSRYTAAMAQKFPECTPGFMSHMLTVLKAYNEAEFPGWREYDYAFRDKMASTGVRDWTKLDVHLYQEHCSSRPKQKSTQQPPQKFKKPEPRGKQPANDRPKWVCWDYNDSVCTRQHCKFPHKCQDCGYSHPKRFCPGLEGK